MQSRSLFLLSRLSSSWKQPLFTGRQPFSISVSACRPSSSTPLGGMSERLVGHFKDGKQTLPLVPIAERLSDRVYVVLGMNPSAFSLRGTNTYIVGTGPSRILIDTGDADFTAEYIPLLRQAVTDAGATGIEQIVVTHWHRDHIGGVQAVLDAFGRNIPVRKFEPKEGPDELWSGEGEQRPDVALANSSLKPLVDGEVFHTDGATLRVLHTPGHANDHVALCLEEEGAMFTGDNVLGTGTPVFRDLPLYLRSLRLMHAECRGRLYTSHGPVVTDGPALIATYIEHRTTRVTQVQNTLASVGGSSQTAQELTRSIYTQIPEHLIGAATLNTLQALRVLREDGIVACDAAATAPLEQLFKTRWRIIREGVAKI